MDLMQLLVEHFGEAGEDKIKAFLDAMKANNIHTAGEENLDIRYSKLKEQSELSKKELEEAKKLIFSFKESATESDDLKLKVTSYEQAVTKMQAENERLKLQNEARFALLTAKAKADSIDFLLFKTLNADVKLSESGELTGFDPEEIKKQYPSHFEDEKKKEVIVNELKDGDKVQAGLTKDEFHRLSYEERAKLFRDDRPLFDKLIHD
ncbi:MAG: hypothetical protein FWF59_12015 [Turicibacter sp.]|nr:hypothetical protein [Turicibacter sp.]